MAKWCGNIGFEKMIETEPGLYEPEISVRRYRGDVISRRFRNQSSGEITDGISISNVIQIVADSFANENIGYMSYIEWKGSKWKITDVNVLYPRLELTIGGLYNG